ncbi:YsnF/AvaK domain-containing protein [Candidatus Gracilibacteria bacterium]|nr:YsnF/AvaK domain-containing protein [Candidatus Gracilibacteria bacterium]
MLAREVDGHYAVALSRAELVAHIGDDQRIVLPVVAEELHVEKREHTTGRVRVRKLVREQEETVDETLLREYVEVERVPLNQALDAPATVRYDGEVMVIPVMEELLVVEKRLVLREEIRLVKRVAQIPHQQTVTLRSEEVVVERDPRETPTDGALEQ